MRKRTGDRDSKKQKTAGDEAVVSSSAQPRPSSSLLWWVKRGLLVVCVIYVSVPFMMRLFPDIIKHLVYSHRVRVPFFVNLSQPADLYLNHTVNMYLKSEQGISLGVWHTVPESQWKEAQGKDLEWYQDSLGAGMPIIIYLHGNGGTRAANHRVGLVRVLSAIGYHVLALDYRGFGDSTGEPTEVGLTTDTLYLYQWVKARSGSSLVVLWGHSLGTGVATNTAVKLIEQGIVVDGVIIEGAYTNIRQGGAHHPFGWFYWKFPGFEYFFQLEYSYLLTSQLESQRIYWENKIVHLEKDTAEEINNMKAKFKETIDRCDNLERRLGELAKDKQSMDKKCGQLSTRVTKLGHELKEEQEMNRCLRANQVQLQAQLAEEERKARETGERKDGVIAELQEQLRDVMFYLETQQQIEGLPPETRTEIQEGSINIGAAATPAPGPSAIGRGRRGRSKRGK